MKKIRFIFLYDEKIFFDNFFSKLELYVSTFDSSAIYHSAIPWSTLTAAYVSKTPSDGGTPDFYNGAFILRVTSAPKFLEKSKLETDFRLRLCRDRRLDLDNHRKPHFLFRKHVGSGPKTDWKTRITRQKSTNARGRYKIGESNKFGNQNALSSESSSN